MKVLIIAEHDHQQLAESTAHVVTAAKQLSDDVTVLVAGSQCQGVAEQAAASVGVKQVLVADNSAYAHQLAENTAELIYSIAESYDYLLAPASTFGKNLMPRVAALLDVGQLSDVIAILDKDRFKRPIYAGNAIATVKSLDSKKVITIRPTAFAAEKQQQTPVAIEPVMAVYEAPATRFVEHSMTASERPELTSANVVVSGGRGVGSAENFVLIEKLADCLGAAVGATRAVVDAGFVPNDYQVGQTGKIVAPELYIAVGISGAIQHIAGMKDSKVIVAINKDPDAPIFSVADYGLVGDLFDIVPELQNALTK
ncbi:MAG: electron transfer flavoprotein subunit alpha [Legionellales bacterium]|nr:electron transfer flavoprotein subunit alpha [Legionellales bacterium]|tara:strand:- start:559 stop:1494 length:936 start_codon:yes stop_codon:yes gene_type:complete